MKNTLNYIVLSLLWVSLGCENPKEISSINPVNWEKRAVKHSLNDSLTSGSSYLSVYSEIYSETEHATINLTATVSLRNINKKDTIFLEKAEYYNTHGQLIRSYFNKPIFIAPLETVEIVIDERDKEGGSGANFIFDWMIQRNTHEPFFECAMISTYGQQGLSFTTQGIRID
ncbi:MAG: DUF3124 domain-containing protein [Flavobacteriaceae bacterium]|nr:DUF3124 domain-containing protein [Flavobacteriaceae bacterium]